MTQLFVGVLVGFIVFYTIARQRPNHDYVCAGIATMLGLYLGIIGHGFGTILAAAVAGWYWVHGYNRRIKWRDDWENTS